MTPSGLLQIEDAQRLVLDSAGRLESEEVELGKALGRVLGEDALADEPVPPFDNAAMDGFAVRAADLAGAGEQGTATLRIAGESRAGAPAAVALQAGEAIAISTGAMLPQGADAVVRVEDTRTADGRVEVRGCASSGQDVRYRGADVRAGQLVLERGTLLGPAELGVLASLGRGSARCARRPRVAILISGDELLSPGEPSRPGAIRDSNSLSVSALARCAGAEVVRLGRVSDDADAVRAAIAQAADGVDVLVICGGVSVGAHDHVRSSLEQLGAQTAFWGLALKPGRPAWFGTLGSALVFGLPGNPVSAMVTFVLLVGPALRALLGRRAQPGRMTAVLDCDYEKEPGRAHAVRCHLREAPDGWHAMPTGPQDSHVLSSMLGADALAFVPSGVSSLAAGERVEIEPLHAWTGAPA